VVILWISYKNTTEYTSLKKSSGIKQLPTRDEEDV